MLTSFRYATLFLLLLPAILGQAQQKVAYNLGLETIDSTTGLPVGWGMGNVSSATVPADSTASRFRVDSKIKKTGARSLLIDWTGAPREWTATNYVINKTFKGRKIKLTGWLKTENADVGAGLWMRLDTRNGKEKGFDNMMDRSVKGTTDWKMYTIELPYDQDEVTSIVVGHLIVGTGKVWLDDLKITIDGTDIAQLPEYTPAPKFKADKDNTYNKGSGIDKLPGCEGKITELTNLGMLWGFIKYYHAHVARGDYNMDAELFRLLPGIMNAPNTDSANAAMERWVDGLGKPAPCAKCTDFVKDEKNIIAPDYGYLFKEGNLPPTLVAKLEYIKKNRREGKDHYYISTTKMVGNPVFENENTYPDNVYPDAGTRLLALYRYWNTIQYFFPDKHLIGEDWNKVLGEFIPRFCNAPDSTGYVLTCLELISRIHDTHANIWSQSEALSNAKGKMITQFSAQFIEGKLVVSGYYKDDTAIRSKVKRGDIIEQIDGTPVDELVKRYLPVTAASNYETQLRDLPKIRGFLLRSNKPEATLILLRGEERLEVTIPRIAVETSMMKYDYNNEAPDAAYRMLDGNIGYIYPALLKESDLKDIKDSLNNTKGIVIDMRCYPGTFMPFNYGSWLKSESSPFVKFTLPDPDIPGRFTMGQLLSNGGGISKRYAGRIIIIVNATTQSQAEYTTMALSTAAGAKVIGSITAGADGNVSDIILPGKLRTMISGIGILYPDGTETQRLGVKIDKVVTPTIKGYREGRDELLEEAVKMLQ